MASVTMVPAASVAIFGKIDGRRRAWTGDTGSVSAVSTPNFTRAVLPHRGPPCLSKGQDVWRVFPETAQTKDSTCSERSCRSGWGDRHQADPPANLFRYADFLPGRNTDSRNGPPMWWQSAELFMRTVPDAKLAIDCGGFCVAVPAEIPILREQISLIARIAKIDR